MAKEYLQGVITEEADSLRSSVAEIILDECEESPVDYIRGVLNHGCVSGLVGALTYYSDTEKFFTENMNEIFELFNNLYGECGFAPLPSKHNDLNANNLAWLGFEETCREFQSQIEELEECEEA